MKNKLFTLAAALMLAAVIGGVYAAPALAAVIKAALVKNVDEKGRVPFQATGACTGGAGFCSATNFIVPMDKRLVIEHVAVHVHTPVGVKVDEISVGGSTERGYLHADFNGNFGVIDSHTANATVLAYFEPGEGGSVFVNTKSGFASITVDAIISGYLVDLTI